MSHLEKILDETFGKKKPKQVEVSVERLHPPKVENLVSDRGEMDETMLPLTQIDLTDERGLINSKTLGKPIESETSVPVRIEGESRTALPSNLEGVATTDSKIAIDFNNMPNTYWKWCDRLETKRTWYHARFDKVHRGSIEELKKDVQERDQELDIVKLMKKQQKPIFIGVMNEYKNKLAKLKEKR